jgi:Zn-dependent peptidase ImmA (M78 family)
MHDFRRLPGEIAGVQSPELRYEIRRAINRRELAVELLRAAEESVPTFPVPVSSPGDAQAVARRIRKMLNISLDSQWAWPSGYDTFNNWRRAFERIGVLVLQMTSVDISEVRGFSIGEMPLPVVVLNSKDTVAGRCFTMFHELAHILLHKGGLCDLDDHTRRAPAELKMEVFCNMVAGCALVPRKAFLQEPIVRANARKTGWADDELSRLARRYGVSREVVLRRLLTLGRTSEAFYQVKRRQYRREAEDRRERRREGFAPPHSLAISSAGPMFVRLVLNSYYEERITASDVADLLEVRLKHLAKIEEAVLGKSGAEP